jgi:hypothetical protein
LISHILGYSINSIHYSKWLLDLYFNQNKNIREISQIAKMSFREIGTILDKARGGEEKEATKEQTEKQSLSTQAYKSFFQKVKLPPATNSWLQQFWM